MEVITIDSKAFKKLMEKLDALSDYVYSMKQSPEENDDESWVDSHEVCDFLKISERTLQRLRSNEKSRSPAWVGSITIRSARLRNC